jgi:hypothetical protein
MARKRMLSPDLWKDPGVIQLSNNALIVMIGCISNADDEGIIETDPDSLYFELARKEFDTTIIVNSLQEIYNKGILCPYGEYAFFPNWFKHQKIDRPTETKKKRPTKDILEDHPGYVKSWEMTFSTRDNVVTYPYDTCFILPDDSSSNRRGVVEGSPPMERKGKKEKGKEINPLHDKSCDSEKELFNSVDSIFLSQNDGKYPDWGKERKHIYTLIKKACANSPQPESFIKIFLETFLELKTRGSPFWKSQSFLPSIAISSGIFPRILEEMKSRQPKTDEDLLSGLEGIL